MFIEHDTEGTVPGAKGNSEKQNEVVLRFRTHIICILVRGDKRKYKKMAVQNKVSYKTKSNSKTILLSQGVEREASSGGGTCAGPSDRKAKPKGSIL